MTPNEPQVKSLRARKLKRIIVYWKYYDKEMYDHFYHFPHWTSHAVFCNITYDIWIKYSRGFYNYVYTAFYNLSVCRI